VAYVAVGVGGRILAVGAGVSVGTDAVALALSVALATIVAVGSNARVAGVCTCGAPVAAGTSAVGASVGDTLPSRRGVLQAVRHNTAPKRTIAAAHLRLP